MSSAQLPDRRADWFSDEKPFVATGDQPPVRPNIVFVLADDMGWGDLGCYGSLHNSTPNLDALAADGVRFEHAYATSPTCSPTRVSLYTGRYPGRLAVGLQEPLLTRDSEHGIPPEHPTLPSLLKDSGYQTSMFGKWHCGWLPWFSPQRIGFETFFGNMDGVLDYYGHVDSTGTPDLYEGEEPVEVEGYYTDLLTDRAVGCIRDRDPERPFYMQVNYTAPHWPWETREDTEVSERITEAVGEEGMRALFHFDGGSLATYREMVRILDEGVGKILAAIDDEGIRENTIVIFASDNGGERYAFLWPFVGEKGDLEEGGIRVPNVIRWPAAIAPNGVTDVPIITMDWTASLLDAAGVTPPESHPLDGMSLLPWLVGGAAEPDRALYWRTSGQGAMRRGKYKLLHDRVAKPLWPHDDNFEGSRTRLFDVLSEGREKADLSPEERDVAERMLSEWREFDDSLMPYPSHEPELHPETGETTGFAD